MIKIKAHIALLSLFTGVCFAQQDAPKHEKVFVEGIEPSTLTFIHSNPIHSEGWDTLANTGFWRQLITLQPDSGLLNIASSRTVIGCMPASTWERKQEFEREAIRDSIRNVYCLEPNENILFSRGKGDFYKIDRVIPTIDRAIKIFEMENTDPFYAQSILLIESPGKLQKSSVGAYGPFQLMRSVAVRMGLKVNRYIDERKDFDKCAMGAAKLIRTICVPETRSMLTKRCIPFNENDLWFKLLVLHVYHAGAGNVAPAIDKAGCWSGGPELIRCLWKTKAGAFGNASQNYSQVALASLLEMEEIIQNKCSSITFECETKPFIKPADSVENPLNGSILSDLIVPTAPAAEKQSEQQQ